MKDNTNKEYPLFNGRYTLVIGSRGGVVGVVVLVVVLVEGDLVGVVVLVVVLVWSDLVVV